MLCMCCCSERPLRHARAAAAASMRDGAAAVQGVQPAVLQHVRAAAACVVRLQPLWQASGGCGAAARGALLVRCGCCGPCSTGPVRAPCCTSVRLLHAACGCGAVLALLFAPGHAAAACGQLVVEVAYPSRKYGVKGTRLRRSSTLPT